MAGARVEGDLLVEGALRIAGTKPGYTRSEQATESGTVYTVPHERWRVWDAHQTNLPGTPATDDLGLVVGTWGTNVPSIQTEDLKAAGATNKRAGLIFILPPEFVAAGNISIRAYAGMLTTVADTTATIDFELYKSARDNLVSGSDLVTTAATTINSLTFANKTFTVNGASLSPGDILHVRMTLAINDAASGTTVKGCVGDFAFLMDTKN